MIPLNLLLLNIWQITKRPDYAKGICHSVLTSITSSLMVSPAFGAPDLFTSKVSWSMKIRFLSCISCCHSFSICKSRSSKWAMLSSISFVWERKHVQRSQNWLALMTSSKESWNIYHSISCKSIPQLPHQRRLSPGPVPPSQTEPWLQQEVFRVYPCHPILHSIRPCHLKKEVTVVKLENEYLIILLTILFYHSSPKICFICQQFCYEGALQLEKVC